MNSLSFRYLFPNYGGISQLFIDYVYNFKNVQRYYAHDFSNFDDLPRLIEIVLKNYKNRKVVVNVLKNQNLPHRNPNVDRSLELLSRDNTLAVVTGQQVGLFSGPVYTIYKIITAIKLAYFLSDRFPEFNFVPVFYLESEDHDFLESNNVKILNSKNEIIKIEFNPDLKKENYGPVGKVEFGEKIDETLKALEDALQETEFKAEVLKLIRFAYSKGSNFAQAFVKFVGGLFKDFDLIFLNPDDVELKKLLIPIFEKEIDEHPKLSELIVDVSAELEERYHAQIKPRPLNLFLLYKGGRFPIEPADEEGIFRLKGARFKLSRGELKNILETSPHLLSPNVVLRPICQDTLLPTICYVAGPSEIAYFAQLKPAYAYFNVPMPVIFPRISATLIEPKVRKVLEKYGVDVREVFTDFGAVAKKILLSSSDLDIDGFFNVTKARFESMLNEIKEFVAKIDPTLVGAVDNSGSKILYHINSIYEKTISGHQKRNEIISQQIEKLKVNLLPEDELQERVLNITYFLNKYSLGLIEKLFDELEAFDFNHQVVYL
jgi:bacillithiol biosynthesis cysteine-adding enzyme BshC